MTYCKQDALVEFKVDYSISLSSSGLNHKIALNLQSESKSEETSVDIDSTINLFRSQNFLFNFWSK